MITAEQALKVTCPRCGAGPGAPCVIGSRGKIIATYHSQRIGRLIDERNFYRWVDEQLALPKNRRFSEQEFLDTIKRPGWTGMKAGTNPPARKVFQMPLRDFGKAAAGDSDEAA
jgi:hypothetical protein